METSEIVQSKLEEEKSKLTSDKRPSHLVYALMSKQTYRGSDLKKSSSLIDIDGNPDSRWTVKKTLVGKSGYCGVIFLNKTDNQIVVVHRGTNTLKSLLQNLYGIYRNKLSKHNNLAYKLTVEAVEMARSNRATLSFTGYSLGAFLAELSVFYCCNTLKFPDVSAVTFESPGSKGSLDELQFHSRWRSGEIDLTDLDVTSYVSSPSLINTCNYQIGTLYLLSIGSESSWYSEPANGIDDIIRAFNSAERPVPQCVKTWPIGSSVYRTFFESEEFKSSSYSKDDIAQCERHFRVQSIGLDEELSKNNVLALKHFSTELQGILLTFFNWKQGIKTSRLASYLVSLKINDTIVQHLLQYIIKKTSSRKLVVVLPTEDIMMFRKQLSWWLEKYGYKLQKLMAKYPDNIREGKEIIEGLCMPNGSISKVDLLKKIRALTMSISESISMKQSQPDLQEDAVKPKISRMVFFGDSLSDRGTAERRIIGDVLPMRFASGLKQKSLTGRFTNGLVWIDYLAETLISGRTQAKRDSEMSQGGSVPFSPPSSIGMPSYIRLDTQVQASWNNELMYTYAEGGLTSARYHDRENIVGSIIGSIVGDIKECFLSNYILSNLDKKRILFLQHENEKRTTSKAKEDTLIVEWSGANDLITLQPIPEEGHAKSAVYARIENVRSLIERGYRNFVLINLPNLSLTPRYQKLRRSIQDTVKNVCDYFNNLLSQQVDRLKSEYPSCKFVYYDANRIFEEGYKNPIALGFAVDKIRLSFCSDEKNRHTEFQRGSRYMFWDDVHPDTEVHKTLSDDFYITMMSKFVLPANCSTSLAAAANDDSKRRLEILHQYKSSGRSTAITRSAEEDTARRERPKQ